MVNKKVSIIKNVNLINYFFNNEFKFTNFDKFPFIKDSDGCPSMPINMYLQSDDVINLSYVSIRKKAYDLSQLLSYCNDFNINLLDLNETDFINFSFYLKESNNERANDTINFILKTVLAFYNYVGKEILGIEAYSQNNLGAEIVSTKIILKDYSSVIDRSGLYHRCFLKPSPKTKRTPIGESEINKLHEAIPQISKNSFVMQRNMVILRLLEITGARAGEIAMLKVDDIEECLKQVKPMLKLITLKRGSDQSRLVPVQIEDLQLVKKYIKIHRKRLVKNKLQNDTDEGYLLLNETTGKKLQKESITNELKRLKDKAGIEGQACAHMFRHRFITKHFVRLIKQYDMENQDDFRNALMDINSLKIHIQQLTGHKSTMSLDHYIDMAKDELTNMKSVLNKVENENKKEAFLRFKNELFKDFEDGIISKKEFLSKINIKEEK